MKLLFVADPLESFKTYKDSTFTMMREAARRGHTLLACEPRHLRWASGGVVRATMREITLTGGEHDWFAVAATHDAAVHDTSAVLMRKDPPFDSEYFYATHLLGQAERDGAKVFNKPAALRDHPEKLAILEFPQFIGPTLVTRDEADVKAFHAEHHDIILKPLDGMGGMGIFRVGPDGLNLGSIVETLNQGGAQTIMVQRYLPEITRGDKRVLVIGGEAVPYCLARIPQGSEIRGNLAAGGKGVAQPLSERDREIAATLGPVLAARGLLLVGLDVIGNHLTEINVTSPTCFAEITQQSGFDVARRFIDALEAARVNAVKGMTARLDAGAAFDCEYHGGLSNHRPMALLALARLGASETRLAAFDARYSQRLQAAPPAAVWPAGDAWAQRLGERDAWPMYRHLFWHWLASEDAGDVLKQVLPVLMHGCGAAAFHGLIRTAYAVQAQHHQELADALAYWACRWLDLGAAATGDEPDPEAVLRALPVVASDAGLIFQRMADAAADPRFDGVAQRLAVDGHTLQRLSLLAAQAYARSGNFTALHLLTSAHALRVLLPHIEEPMPVVAAYARAFNAAVCVAGLRVEPAVPRLRWETIVARAEASDDDHVVKLVDSAREQHAALGGAVWQAAASRAVATA